MTNPFEALGPLLSKPLLDLLDQAVPPRCMARGETVEDHLRYAGQRELVESLRFQFEQANSLQGTVIRPT